MSVEHFSASAEDLARAVAFGPEYYRPVLESLRYGCTLAIGLPGTEPFAVPLLKPTIFILSDDADGNAHRRGPGHFENRSLRDFIRKAGACVVTSCQPLFRAYAAAASTAVLTKRHVLIVETRPEVEADWIDFIRKENPKIRMLVATVKPEGGVH